MNADENLAAARAHLGGESVSLDEADRRVRETMNRGALPPHDEETGEIIDAAPKAEIIEPDRAADGTVQPYAASTLGEVMNMLERGQFSADVIVAMAALGKGMTELHEQTGKRQKGAITLKLSLTTEGDAFFVEADFTVRAPKAPRPRTLAWQDDKGRFTPSQPRQKLLFGVKGTEHGPRVIHDIDQPRDIRTI